MNIFFLTENTVAEAQPKDRNVQAQYDPSVAALPQDDTYTNGAPLNNDERIRPGYL
jgi:hypothetical protein